MPHSPYIVPLPAGSTIGVIGGGQLGRMIAMAAAEYGYHAHVYTPQDNAPAAEVARDVTVAAYDDKTALIAFAQAVDAVAVEFENVPSEAAELLAEHVPFSPSPALFAICQHRIKEKEFINACNVATARFAVARTVQELHDGVAQIGVPCIVKSTTMGYDGKGQARIRDASDCDAVWQELGGVELIIEAMVPFVYEASVMIARTARGDVQCFPVARNVHENGILTQSVVPSGALAAVEARMEIIARAIAEKCALVGILAIECFVMDDGDVLVNEMAPRPHNSMHWSMDGCSISQFHQLVRAVAGLPLVKPIVIQPTTMYNLIGDAIADMQPWYADNDASVYLYGKGAARAGRKMGHVNVVTSRSSLDS